MEISRERLKEIIITPFSVNLQTSRKNKLPGKQTSAEREYQLSLEES